MYVASYLLVDCLMVKAFNYLVQDPWRTLEDDNLLGKYGKFTIDRGFGRYIHDNSFSHAHKGILNVIQRRRQNKRGFISVNDPDSRKVIVKK